MSNPYVPYNQVVMDIRTMEAVDNSTELSHQITANLAAILKNSKFSLSETGIRNSANYTMEKGIRQDAFVTFRAMEKEDKSVFRFLRLLMINYPKMTISFMLAEVNAKGEVMEASRISGKISELTNPIEAPPSDAGHRRTTISISGYQDFAPEMEKLASSLISSERIDWKAEEQA